MLYHKIIILVFGVGSVISASLQSTRVKREDEIHDNSYLPGHQIQLVVPAVAQTLNFTCGPSIALALVRYWGFRGLADGMVGSITGNLCADGLYMRMITHGLIDGTEPTNFVVEINRWIVRNNYNSARSYAFRYLQPSVFSNNPSVQRIDYNSHDAYLTFARFVYNSLANNAPVAFGFNGRIGTNEARVRGHFILITGVAITEGGATFSYMDPDGGVHRTFQHFQLNRLLEGGGALIYYDPTGFYVPPRRVLPNPDDRDHCAMDVTVGGSAGTSSGLVAGAIAGSAVPGIGTVIGGFVGALVGAAIGLGAGVASGC